MNSDSSDFSDLEEIPNIEEDDADLNLDNIPRRRFPLRNDGDWYFGRQDVAENPIIKKIRLSFEPPEFTKQETFEELEIKVVKALETVDTIETICKSEPEFVGLLYEQNFAKEADVLVNFALCYNLYCNIKSTKSEKRLIPEIDCKLLTKVTPPKFLRPMYSQRNDYIKFAKYLVVKNHQLEAKIDKLTDQLAVVLDHIAYAPPDEPGTTNEGFEEAKLHFNSVR